jgi:hypothetical protein
VIVSGEVMSKELFYVAASRGQKSIAVYTSDAELFEQSIARSTARQLATELAARLAAQQVALQQQQAQQEFGAPAPEPRMFPAFCVNDPSIQPYLMRRLDCLPRPPVESVPEFARVAFYGDKCGFWRFDIVAGKPCGDGDYLLYGQEDDERGVHWRTLALSTIRSYPAAFLQTHPSRIQQGTAPASPKRPVSRRAANEGKKSGRGLNAAAVSGRLQAFAPDQGRTDARL